MQQNFTLKSLATAITLLSASQAVQAITPWQANDGNASNYGTPDVVIYTSGGAAQDLAYSATVANALAQSGTLDVFQDLGSGSAGSRWSGYYFIGNSSLPTGLKGKKIYLEKRSLGAAGYGVIPLLNGLSLDHLNIFTPTASLSATWTSQASTSTLSKVSYQATISSANASSFLTSTQSHGGFLGVDIQSLLQPGTHNYPAAVSELTTGNTTAHWPDGTYSPQLNWNNVKSTLASAVTVIPTGGLAYSVTVTADLYKVLQAAQVIDGTLPSSTTIGDYSSESVLPSLSHNTIAALLSGSIETWDQLQVVDSSNTAYALNSSTVLNKAGITSPHVAGSAGVGTIPSDYRVAFSIRNDGAAVGAVHYAKFLNYPYINGQYNKPGTAETTNNAATEQTTLPLFKAPGGASATASLLVDWQTGANASTLNNATDGSAKNRYWGIAVNSADRSDSVKIGTGAGPRWKTIKVDGYAPTLSNIASGNYNLWAEGQLLISNSQAPSGTPAYNLLKALANDLGSVTNAGLVDADSTTAQPWGVTGIFATTAQAQNAALAVQVPFNNSSPLVSFSHLNGTYTSLGVTPVPYDNGNQTYTNSNGDTVLKLQLK